MNKILPQKKMNYQLRKINLLTFPKAAGSKYDFNNTFGFRASQLWNQVVPNSIKSAPSAKHFKTEMLKNWRLNAHAVCANKQKHVFKILQ